MKHQSVTKTKYWHTIFSQLFSFTLRHKLCLSEYSPSRQFLHALCVFDRWYSSEAQSVLCLSVLECAAHTHTRAQTHTHTLQPGEQRLSCGLYFQHFIIKHVQQFSNCKDCILQQSTDDWSDSDIKSNQNQITSNQITFIVTSPQHKCLGEWNSYERAPDSAKKTIYIWTVRIYRLYRRQCAKYTYIYSVHIVYYKDILNYQLHIIHRMCTSTLCTLSIHYVVYT